LQTGGDTLMLMGVAYDTMQNKWVLSSISYNYNKNTFNINKQSFLNYPSNNPRSILYHKNKNYWMASFDNSGLGLFISDNGSVVPQFRNLPIDQPSLREHGKPNFEQLWSLCEDRSGHIWAASRQNGLYKINKNKAPVDFIPVSTNGHGETQIIFDNIKQDKEGNIWLSSNEQGIFKYNSSQTNFFPQVNKSKYSNLFLTGNDNNLTISTANKVDRYSSSSGFYSFPTRVPDSLRVVARDNFGNYWTIVKKNDINPSSFYLLDGKKIHHLTMDSILFFEGSECRDVFIGKNGDTWVSSPFTGVHQYKLDNSTKKLSFVKKYLPDGTDVYTIYQDDNGIVWLGTYNNGLIKLNPASGNVKYYTRQDGLPSNFVIRIVPAGNILWVVTDVGTFFLDTKTDSFLINKDLDEYVRQKTDGSFYTPVYSLSFNKPAITIADNKIAFTAKNGFCIFDPRKISIDTIKPSLYISALNINDAAVSWERNDSIIPLQLKYFQNNLVIDYIGLQYDQPQKNQYAYYLKGVNNNWVAVGSERTARFSDLPPGHFEFYLKGANADGVWSPAKKMLSFTILPPWWKTWWAYSLYAVAFFVSLWAFIMYRSRTLKKKNVLLETKVKQRTNELHQSLEDLKATQKQLIQSEKMASLGELTAGIAHEIQNPLNFVNNFSEVSNELIEELIDERSKTKEERDEGLEEDILNDVAENLKKINHHGKRADAIVKGMLQHSRSSSGKKELTDINALGQEYLHLCYHGLRAKDKNFNAVPVDIAIKTNFESSLEKIPVVPQDIGRVFLNLFNNAFYAVNEHSNFVKGEQYHPVVSVSTKSVKSPSGDLGVLLTVSDNGSGIPQNIVDKIFQPFFTTKPTGQGTGLGLSLTYDIVKAHGGHIKVETAEGEGTTFIVHLPVTA
jgi:signal transduction histidine kinase/streptogramin lyase